jgi:hypothetical protein
MTVQLKGRFETAREVGVALIGTSTVARYGFGRRTHG